MTWTETLVLCDLLSFKIYMVQSTRLYNLLYHTCFKSSVVRGPGPVVRRWSPQSLPEPVSRRPPTHTSDSALIDVHPTPTSLQFRATPTSLQFRVLYTYVRMYMQSHQRNHHYRDFLYNIRHNTEHKYITLGCLRTRHTVNIIWTPWDTVSSLAIPDTTYPKKNQCPLPESDTTDSLIPQSTLEQTWEKTPIIRSRANVRLSMMQVLFPPCDEVKHDTPITHRLIGTYLYDTCMHLCPYTPRRRCHGVGRRQPLTDPSPGTMSHIYSPFPDLVTSYPSPFKFVQESCFLFFLPPWSWQLERIPWYDGGSTHTLSMVSMGEYVSSIDNLIHIIYSLHLYNEVIHTHTHIDT